MAHEQSTHPTMTQLNLPLSTALRHGKPLRLTLRDARRDWVRTSIWWRKGFLRFSWRELRTFTDPCQLMTRWFEECRLIKALQAIAWSSDSGSHTPAAPQDPVPPSHEFLNAMDACGLAQTFITGRLIESLYGGFSIVVNADGTATMTPGMPGPRPTPEGLEELRGLSDELGESLRQDGWVPRCSRQMQMEDWDTKRIKLSDAAECIDALCCYLWWSGFHNAGERGREIVAVSTHLDDRRARWSVGVEIGGRSWAEAKPME